MYNRTTPYLAPGNMDTRNQTAHLGQYWHCYPNPRKPDNGIIHYTQRNGKLKVIIKLSLSKIISISQTKLQGSQGVRNN